MSSAAFVASDAEFLNEVLTASGLPSISVSNASDVAKSSASITSNSNLFFALKVGQDEDCREVAVQNDGT